MGGVPHLKDAIALLRIARDENHIDHCTGGLSTARIPLQDLRAALQKGDSSRARSLSVFMLCNQDTPTLENIAKELTTSEQYKKTPRGAAAKISSIEEITHNGQKAFLVEEELCSSKFPGHVGITFAESFRNCDPSLQRLLRERIIACFGKVKPLAEVRAEKCEAPAAAR